uniref:Uncharacterized protein n=1 Tax=Arundo donax TaxID=35708 RepID=A0A0A9BLQ3_ARUDO
MWCFRITKGRSKMLYCQVSISIVNSTPNYQCN